MTAITPTSPVTSKTDSPLKKGNSALRADKPEQAILHYLAALAATPGLSKAIATNLAMARQKYRAQRNSVCRPRVAVCGWALSHTAADRVGTLVMLYETFADVTIIGSLFPGVNTAVSGLNRDSTIGHHLFVVEDGSSFIEQAIELVAAHPYDVVHLAKPRAPNIFVGILYKLIWGAKVFIDIDDEEIAIVGAGAPISIDDYLHVNGGLPSLHDLASSDWTSIAVSLASDFDGITVTNQLLQRRYGGEIITELPVSANLSRLRKCVDISGIAPWVLSPGSRKLCAASPDLASLILSLPSDEKFPLTQPHFTSDADTLLKKLHSEDVNTKQKLMLVAPDNGLPSEQQKAYIAFNEVWYRNNYPEKQGSKLEVYIDYMNEGWKELKNPNGDFSTDFYLAQNKDIKNAGINPFLHYINHGRDEGRAGISIKEHGNQNYKFPLVTVIIPNYNHAKYLQQRFDCIDMQTYPSLEIIILDDKSSDNSLEVINSIKSRRGRKITKIFNDTNSGGVFKQWRKGFNHAQGELIWICESDDFCELNFLEELVGVFKDPSVMIAFGKIQFSDERGLQYEGLDAYRESAENKIWGKSIKRSAKQWFTRGFAISNLIPNVGGCLIRNQPIASSIWDEAGKYKICGDWYLYLALSQGGQIAYEPSAIAYFRQHKNNTSVKGFIEAVYYKEHEKIAFEIQRRWRAPPEIINRFYENLKFQYLNFQAESTIGNLQSHFNYDKIAKQERTTPHVLIAFLGFSLGGGEIVPILLANALSNLGLNVSVMVLDYANENLGVRDMLSKSIPIYYAGEVEQEGIYSFINRIGVDLIHSHVVAVDHFFFEKHDVIPPVPYVSTLHGSYEVTPLPDRVMKKILDRVAHWYYLADKNLQHLNGDMTYRGTLSQVRNGFPDDDRPFPNTRAEMGIPPDAFVFAVASRAIKEKGWAEAIEALELAQRQTPTQLFLLLAGDGNDLKMIKEKYIGRKNIIFLGYQSCIHGLYRLADCALLPTRFLGESYPLTLIQALQVGRPIIATKIGEIKNMITSVKGMAGLLINFEKEPREFIDQLAKAMIQIINTKIYSSCAAISSSLGMSYSISDIAKSYATDFEKFIASACKLKEIKNEDGASI